MNGLAGEEEVDKELKESRTVMAERRGPSVIQTPDTFCQNCNRKGP